jgi:microcystin-dependent protein
MDEMFIGAMAIFGCNFPPKNWAFCNGQLIPIAQNTALFSLLGTTFGGNGTTNFGLPNLQSRIPIGQFQGPGLQDYTLGQMTGEENHSLLLNELPSHTHNMLVNNLDGDINIPTASSAIALANDINGDKGMLYSNLAPNTILASTTIGQVGNGLPHSNLQPYLAVNVCICLFGVFPSRN